MKQLAPSGVNGQPSSGLLGGLARLLEGLRVTGQDIPCETMPGLFLGR
jgi:hypothetical protein